MSGSESYYRNVRPEVAAFLPADVARVVEIGCGAGNFRKNLPERCEVWGVEPVPAIGKLASVVLDKVLIGTYRDVFASLPDDYFDLVVCNDVIEHMEDHDWFLESVREKMRPGRSFLVGSVPNVRYLSNLFSLLALRDWKYAELGILDRTHLRFFTEKSLRRTLRAHGYTIEELHGINAFSMRTDSIGNLVKSCAARLAAALLGSDTRYAQFGFRVCRSK